MIKIFRWARIIFDGWRSFFYYLTISEKERKKEGTSKYLWQKTIACSCGSYPVCYPYPFNHSKRKITNLIIGNFLLRKISYLNINEKLKKNNSVYVKTDELDYFERKILPKIRIPFVLVTGDCDDGIKGHLKIVKNKYLLHWFAQNCDVYHKKISILPIGFDYGSLIFKDIFLESKKSAKEQEKEFEQIITKNLERENRIFANFHLNITHPRRLEIYCRLKNNKNIFWQEKKLPRTESWKLQKKFDFVFSPRGNGIDCHRTWEALILDQIPVVEKTNTPLDDLHKKFPIVMLNSLSEINEKNLKIWKKEYQKKFTPEVKRMLTNEYWIEQIEKKKELR